MVTESEKKVKASSPLFQSSHLKLLLLGKENKSSALVYEISGGKKSTVAAKFSKVVKQLREAQGYVSTADFDTLFAENRAEFFNYDNTFKFFITELQLRDAIGAPVEKCDDIAKLGFIVKRVCCLAVVRRVDKVRRIFAVDCPCEPVNYYDPETGEYVKYISTNTVYQWEDVSKRGKPGHFKHRGRWQHWEEIQADTGWSRQHIVRKCEKYNKRVD